MRITPVTAGAGSGVVVSTQLTVTTQEASLGEEGRPPVLLVH